MKWSKKELEVFPRKYGHFFSDPEKWLKTCNPFSITLATPWSKPMGGPLDKLEDYKNSFTEAMRQADRAFYAMAVKYLWFRLRFGYLARSYYRRDFDRNTNFAYGIFVRHFIDIEKNIYFGQAGGLSVVRSYYHDFVDELFDPREEEPEFPYEHITLSHFAVVMDMDERIELLDFADENKMRYSDFCDFVANWVLSYNEKYGEKYQMQLKRRSRMAGVENLMKDGSKKGEKKYE